LTGIEYCAKLQTVTFEIVWHHW